MPIETLYLHFIDPWAVGIVYTDTQTHKHYRVPRLRMRTEAYTQHYHALIYLLTINRVSTEYIK